MVCCALVADAVIGNVQEKALKEYKPSNSEMVGWWNNTDNCRQIFPIRFSFHTQLVLCIYLYSIWYSDRQEKRFGFGQLYVDRWMKILDEIWLRFLASNSIVFFNDNLCSCWISWRELCTWSCSTLWCIDCCHRLVGFFVKSNSLLFKHLVTTFRKTITIVLSFIAFTKPFTFQ